MIQETFQMSTEAPAKAEAEAEKSDFTPVTTQAEFDARVKERLAREREKFTDYPDLKKKAEQLDKIEEANRTELENANARADAAEKRASDLEPEVLRWKTIAEHQIPKDYQDFVTGKDEEQLAATVEKVKALIPDPSEPEPAVRELVVPGEGKSPAALNSDALTSMLSAAVGASPGANQ